MNLKTVITSAAFGAAVMFGGAASAATVAACGFGSGLACIADSGTIYYGSGGDKEANVELALADALSISLASADLTLLGKDDAGYGTTGSGPSGSWTAPDAVSYITVKAANSYTIYATGGSTSGSWTTMGILNNGGQQADKSHISFWSGGPMAAVPVPAAGMLLLTALGGFAAFGRRKA